MEILGFEYAERKVKGWIFCVPRDPGALNVYLHRKQDVKALLKLKKGSC